VGKDASDEAEGVAPVDRRLGHGRFALGPASTGQVDGRLRLSCTRGNDGGRGDSGDDGFGDHLLERDGHAL